MALFDLLGRRWCLRILWELREDPATFRELRDRCGGVSPAVLNERLRELAEAGVVSGGRAGGYRLTVHGRALVRALSPLRRWSVAWARRATSSG